MSRCGRCDGDGLSEFRHIASGICFACGATPGGVAEVPLSPRLTYREACDRFGRVVDILTELARRERATGVRAEYARECIQLIRDGITDEVAVMWDWVRRSRAQLATAPTR